MDLEYTILLFSGMVLLAVFTEPLAEKAGLPFAAVLVVLGLAGSGVVAALGIDTGIRWHNFYDLIFYVFLPILIFEAAFSLDARLLLKNILPVLFMAVPVMMLSAGIIAVIVYYGIGHPAGFPWIAALLTGALLSATDPTSVLALFGKIGAPARLKILVEGESLFNDATAIVMTGLLISLSLSGNNPDIGSAVIHFIRVFAGGIVAGAVIGAIGLLLLPGIRRPVVAGVFTLICVYSGYVLSEVLLDVSGVMAVLTIGLVLGHAGKKQDDHAGHVFLSSLWEYKAWIANAMLFLLAGITIQLAMFTDQWLAILIGILAALVSRAIGIYGVIPVLNVLPGFEPIDIRSQTVMYWGGVRGAIALALALSLPLELEYWWTVQSIAYGVVLFTLFVQAPTMAPLMKKLGV